MNEERISTVVGYFAGPEGEGAFRVSFFRPFYGDCRIVWLSPDCDLALVTSNDRSSLCILSRTADLAPPNHTYMRNFVMQNGSTLDLSAKTNVWSTATTLAKCTDLTFEPGARVNVDITGRDLRLGDQVIASPVDLTGLSFNPVVKSGPLLVGFTVRGKGVYCISRATVLFFR